MGHTPSTPAPRSAEVTTARIIASLWVAWSLFHIIPGVIAMAAAVAGDLSSVGLLEPTARPDQLVADYPIEVKAILAIHGQHAFNLFWFGLVTLVCAGWIWSRQSRTAMLLAGVIGGLADLGVIVFIDIINGYGSLFGTAITMLAFGAIGLSVYLATRTRHDVPPVR